MGHEVFTHLRCNSIILGCKHLTMQDLLLHVCQWNAVTQHLHGYPLCSCIHWRERLQELQRLCVYTIASSSVWNATPNKAWVCASHWYVVSFLFPLLSNMRFAHTLQCSWTWWWWYSIQPRQHHIIIQADCLGRKQPANKAARCNPSFCNTSVRCWWKMASVLIG